ncbi:FAD-dependent oxidoreductase [Sphingobium sp.]|uniref:NAD(P)/FAD-dependent oxidoreductase n=1 Tax=Sphingobium sp. TaxID=1912891 RepID=UPI0028BD9A4A|nr:FAD-dependent oxidoreductase [Sphingobium sp.]
MTEGKAPGDCLVVVGGGQAAAQLVEVARQNGFAGQITLVSDEEFLPYQRPPLSKQYLNGVHDTDWLLYRPREFYSKFRVDALLGRRVEEIDRENRRVKMNDGSILAYDKLALTTGTRARMLEVPGRDLDRIYSIRTIADVERLRPQLPSVKRAVIIGAGFIGLETGAVLTQMGIDVVLLGSSTRLLPRIVAGDMAEFLLDQHLKQGVEVVLNAQVIAIDQQDDGQLTVHVAGGGSYAGDVVLVGIGAIANVELAEACGLQCDNGIVVDEFATTSDPNIVAAGDCTNHPNPLVGRRIRLETVHNAVEQGRTAGATIAGVNLPYIQTPWVWSDQYKFRFQSAGIAEGFDTTVLRGTVGSGKFSVFYYVEGKLLAVSCINQPHIFAAVRRILNGQAELKPEEAADPLFDLSRVQSKMNYLEFDIPWPTKEEKGRRLTWGHD